MKRILLAVLVAALAFAAAACSGGEADGDGAGDVAVEGAGTELMEEPAADAASGAAEDEALPAAQRSGSLPSQGPRVIQTASLSISVARDEVQQTIARARTAAAGLGGFVVGSNVSQGEERRLVEASLVVRVPERNYARAMERLSALGRVEAQEEDGQDVSQELVDLESRARHLEAVERQLLELLERADTVPAALAVQGELNRVQLELEQARGRLRHLEDQVAYATITLDVREQRAEVAGAGGGWGIVDAWETAGRGFVAVVGWLLIAAATIAPLVVLLGLLVLAARLTGRPRHLFRRNA